MNNKRKRINLIFISCTLIVSMLSGLFYSALSAHSETIEEMEQQERETQAAISNLEKQTAEAKAALNELNNQKKNSEANVKDLKNQSTNLNSTYQEYSDKLDILTNEIEVTQKAMEETSAQILEINEKKAATEAERITLYNQAKEMIKGIYESGGKDTYMKILVSNLTSGDFFKKAEYISAVIAYEQKIMKQLKDMEDDLTSKAKELEAKQAEIDAYQDELDAKEDELTDLTNDVLSALNKTNSNLSNEKSKLKNFDAKIEELSATMKALESEVAKAQAKLAQQVEKRLAALEAAGQHEYLGGSYSASDQELVWLAATIQAEAGGEPYVGKLAVGTVIMNRVRSSSFPNDIIGVITQNMQFASYRSGMVEAYINRGPNSSCMQAAREVLGGQRVGEYLFFMTRKWADYYRIMDYNMIGNHAFFNRWITYPKPEEPAPQEQVTEQPQSEPQPEPQQEEQPASESQSEEPLPELPAEEYSDPE